MQNRPSMGNRKVAVAAGIAAVVLLVLFSSSGEKPVAYNVATPTSATSADLGGDALSPGQHTTSNHQQRQTPRAVGQHNNQKTPLEKIAEGTFLSRKGAFRGEYGWRFKEYVSSKLELDFYEDVKPYVNDADWSTLVRAYTPRIEQLVRATNGYAAPDLAFDTNTSFGQDCDNYLNASMLHDNEGAAQTCLGRQDALDPDLFSRFIYEFVCLEAPCVDDVPEGHRIGAQRTSYIEPLFGTMRHPLFFAQGGKANHIYNKGYMIVDKWALHHLHSRWRTIGDDKKSFFFDMGASLYTAGFGGASQNWFVGLANCLCVPFTDMHLFEATPHTAAIAWDKVPGYLHPNYRWYNYPLSTDVRSWRNPLNHYLHKASPGDVVTMKVDFDSPGLENKIIETILRTPELYNSIDELFYEYHVKMPYLKPYWKRTVDQNATVMTSIEVFQALRRRGIRAHSWV